MNKMKKFFSLALPLLKRQSRWKYIRNPYAQITQVFKRGFCSEKGSPADASKSEMMKEETIKLKDDQIVKASYSETTLSYTVGEDIKGVKTGTTGLYVMMYTCGVCENKAVRSFSKKAYHEGVVLVRCENCDSLHLIADNLGWFEDAPVNVEELMKRKGEKVITIKDNPEVAAIFANFMKNSKTKEDSASEEVKK